MSTLSRPSSPCGSPVVQILDPESQLGTIDREIKFPAIGMNLMSLSSLLQWESILLGEVGELTLLVLRSQRAVPEVAVVDFSRLGLLELSIIMIHRLPGKSKTYSD